MIHLLMIVPVIAVLGVLYLGYSYFAHQAKSKTAQPAVIVDERAAMKKEYKARQEQARDQAKDQRAMMKDRIKDQMQRIRDQQKDLRR